MLRNKVRYLMLLVSVGLLSILYNEYYMGIIFLTVIAMPFLLFAVLSYIYGKIRAELVSAVHLANKGDQIPISVRLTNPTIFPLASIKIYLSYKNAYSRQRFRKTFMVSLDSRTTSSFVCNLTSQYAGNLEITLEGFRIYDYLKLFSFKRKMNRTFKVAVLPAYYELQDSDILSRNAQIPDSENYSPTRKGDDPSEVFEIREYREGDRLQKIHWKLSRKQNQLMIKEFSDPINCSILLFLNLNMKKGENVLFFMDAMLECVLSFSYTFLLKGQLHYLSWYDQNHGNCMRIRIANEKDLYEAVDGLLQAQPYTETTDALTAYLAQYPHDQYTDLLVITGENAIPSADSLSIIKAYTRQMICMKDINSTLDLQTAPEMLSQYADIGVGLWPVNADNLRNDMEQFSLV